MSSSPMTPAAIAAARAMAAAASAALSFRNPPVESRPISYEDLSPSPFPHEGSRINPIDLTWDQEGPIDVPDLDQDPDDGVVGPLEAHGPNQYPCWHCNDYHQFPVQQPPPCMNVHVVVPRSLPPSSIRTRSSRMILRSGRRI